MDKESDWIEDIYNNTLFETNLYPINVGFVRFWKRPKKENGELTFKIRFRITENIEEFIVSDKIDYYNKTNGIKILDKAINDTAKIFEYEDKTIETALGIVNNKHLSLIFEAIN